LVPDRKAGSYLKLFEAKKNLEYMLLTLDLEQAGLIFRELKLLFAESNPIMKQLSGTFDELKGLSRQRGFEQHYLKLLGSLYQTRYEQALIWFLALLDYVLFRMILPQIRYPGLSFDPRYAGKCKLNGKLINDEKDLFSALPDWMQYKKMAGYHALILKDQHTANAISEFKKLRIRISKGNTLDQGQFRKKLLEVLGIDKNILNTQYDHIWRKDFRELVQNEQGFLGVNTLLTKLHRIVDPESESIELRQRQLTGSLLDGLNQLIGIV